MPPLDPNIALQAQAPKLDLLGTISAAAQAKNQLLGAESAAQTMRARSAIGPIYQGATDPVTGRLDSNKLLAGAAGNPDTAWMAGDLAAAAQAREKEQIAINAANVDLALKQTANLRGRLGSLLADPNTSAQSVVNLASDLVGEGVLTPEQAVMELKSIPRDPGALRQWLTNHYVSTLDGEQKLQVIAGQIGQMDTGNAINVVRINPLTGRVENLATAPKALSPGEMAAPRNAFINGQPGTVPTSTVVDEFGRPRQGAPTGVSGAPGGFLPSGPVLGAEAGANVAGTKSAEQGVALQASADQVPARKAALLSMRDQLVNFESGPAAEGLARLSALAQQFGISGAINPKATSAVEEFNKLSTQVVLQQVAQLGGAGTDDKLAAGIKGNPSSALSKMGNKAVIALMLGNEDAIAAKNEAWQKWLASGQPVTSYGQFSTAFNRNYDPRVFQAVHMNPEDRTAMFRGMSPTEREAYNRALRDARAAGWIK